MATVEPLPRRLAVGLTSDNEAEFVALVELLRPLLADGLETVVVVPALDHDATARQVAQLVGPGPSVVVEPAHVYLRRGHDRTALVDDDPVKRGRSLAGALTWLRTLDGGLAPAADDLEPSEVVSWLGRATFPVPSSARGGAHRGSIAAIPLGDGRLLLRTAWGGKLVVFSADRSLTPDLALDGVYDPAFVRFLERTLPAGGMVVDVGANVGVFTVRMAQLVGPSGSVLALEADPEVHAVLQENLDMNYVSGWTRSLPVAAYSTRETLTFRRTSRFRGNGSIQGMGTSEGNGYATESYADITVDAVPLDDVLADVPHVDLVKIDVEGAERHVLEGLSRTIADGRVTTVAIEFVRAVLGAEWDPLCRRLATYRDGHGASFATVAADGAAVPIELDDAVRVAAFPQVLIHFGGAGHG